MTVGDMLDRDQFAADHFLILDDGELVAEHSGLMKQEAFNDWFEEHTGATNTSRFPSDNLP